MGGAVLIVDLHELNFGELLEVIGQQVRDGVGCVRAVTGPFEVDVGDTVNEFKAAVAGEAVG